MVNEKRRLIDADLLIAYFSGGEEMKSMAESIHDARFVKALQDAPTVDAVPVMHGRWIDDGGLDEDGNGQYRCSQCGVGEKHNPTVTVSYCWNCGAKMEGETE